MHNKRIGRDDVLKIEVRQEMLPNHTSIGLPFGSGPARRLRPAGVSIQVGQVAVVAIALLVVAGALAARLVEAATTMIATDMTTVTATAVTAAIAIAREAPMTGTET